jgi:hypothetical protein
MPGDPAVPANGLRRRLVALILFGLTFGYVEAAAVVLIRTIYAPIHQRLFPDRATDDLFPLITMQQWSEHGPPTMPPLLEAGRELGLVLMVALVACAGFRSLCEWFAAFMLTFGVWDLAYYMWLKVLLGWPHSLSDWDLIFSIPLPWVGPVWAALLVAVAMTVTAAVFFRREAIGQPIEPRWIHWTAVLIGALFIMVAFWWDARSQLAGGIPAWFNWPLLLVGLLIGLAGFVHATSRPG